MGMNVCFEYLYRDAGNFKNWGKIIFSNRKGHSAHYLKQQARKVLIDGEFFVADKANVPNLQFEEHITTLDHDWYEFYSFEPSIISPNDSLGRDIEAFIEVLKYASKI